MDMQYWLIFVLAWMPIMIVMGGIIVFSRTAIMMGQIGFFLTLILSVTVFTLSPMGSLLSTLKGILMTIDIAIIIFGALLFYMITELSGVLKIIKNAIENFSDDKVTQLFLIAVGFAGFLHGVTGYSVPPVVAVPILAALGFSSFDAIIACLIGYSSYMIWGTWGVGIHIGSAIMDIPASDITYISGKIVYPLWFAEPIVMIWVILGSRAVFKNLPKILIISTIGTISMYMLSVYLQVTEIVGFVSALAIMLSVFIYSKIFDRTMTSYDKTKKISKYHLLKALFPYLLIISALMPIKLSKSLSNYLSYYKITISLYEKGGLWSFSPLIHSGVLIIIAAIISGLILGLNKNDFSNAFGKSWSILLPSSYVMVFFFIMSELMYQSGMVKIMGEGAARILGKNFYPLIAPFLAWTACVITGAGAGAHFFFGKFQMEMASIFGTDPLLFVAANTGGGAPSSMSTPNKIIPVATMMGYKGKEGLIMRKTIPVSLLLVTIVSIYLWLIIRFSLY